jgi:hypothetical protein
MNKGLKLSLVTFVTILLVGLFAFTTFADDRATISTSLLQDSIGIYNVTYEQPTTDTLTVYANAEFLSATIVGVNVTGFGVAGGINYYMNEANDGLYVGGGVYYISVTADGGSYLGQSGTFSVIGVDARVGYKKVFDNGIAFNGGFTLFEGLILGIGISL